MPVSLLVCFSFFPKWKEYESRQADMLNFTLEDDQWQRDWALLLALAGQPGMLCLIS